MIVVILNFVTVVVVVYLCLLFIQISKDIYKSLDVITQHNVQALNHHHHHLMIEIRQCTPTFNSIKNKGTTTLINRNRLIDSSEFNILIKISIANRMKHMISSAKKLKIFSPFCRIQNKTDAIYIYTHKYDDV